MRSVTSLSLQPEMVKFLNDNAYKRNMGRSRLFTQALMYYIIHHKPTQTDIEFVKVQKRQEVARFFDMEIKHKLSEAFFFKNVEKHIYKMLLIDTRKSKVLSYLDTAIQKAIEVFDDDKLVDKLKEMQKNIEHDKKREAMTCEAKHEVGL